MGKRQAKQEQTISVAILREKEKEGNEKKSALIIFSSDFTGQESALFILWWVMLTNYAELWVFDF